MKRLLIVALLLAAPAAQAANCNSYPFTLTNGTTADANQVMADFNNILNCGNNNLAKNGANSDITSLSGLTTPLTVVEGGTNLATLTQGAVILGAGTNSPTFVTAQTQGNLLMSNNAQLWVSQQMTSGTYPQKTTPVTGDSLLLFDSASGGASKSVLVNAIKNGVAQIVTTESGAKQSLTSGTVTPSSSIPTSAKGTQIESLAIIPKNASSTCVIEAVAQIGTANSVQAVLFLLQDSTVNSLAAETLHITNGIPSQFRLKHVMTCGTTSSTTFKINYGDDTGGLGFDVNGNGSGSQIFGGVSVTSLTITEYLP